MDNLLCCPSLPGPGPGPGDSWRPHSWVVVKQAWGPSLALSNNALSSLLSAGQQHGPSALIQGFPVDQSKCLPCY